MIDSIRKIMNYICFLLTVIIILISIMYVIGIKPYLMITNSMKPSFSEGSICFIDTKYSFENLKMQDIIMYQSLDQKVIHRIVEKKNDSYKTKGDSNQRIDTIEITEDIYLGKYIFSIPKVGLLTSKIDSPIEKGLFFISLIIFYIIDYKLNHTKKHTLLDIYRKKSR